MKRKKTFVTNSSSTSFIIGCSKIPSSTEEAKEIWFGDKATSVSEEVLKFFFQNFEEYKIDFDKVLELAKTKPWSDIHSYSDNENELNERVFLSEVASKFAYPETHENDGPGCWSSSKKNPFEQYMEVEYEKLNVKNKYDIPWSKRQKLEDAWFEQKEVRDRFILAVESMINKINKQPIHMQTVVGDDSSFTGEIEHNFSWSLFPEHVRFSHH
jgi:hypothetical protein